MLCHVNHAMPCPQQPGPDTTSRLVLSTTSRLVLSVPSRQFLSTTQYRPCPQCYAMSPRYALSTTLFPVHHNIPCSTQPGPDTSKGPDQTLCHVHHAKPYPPRYALSTTLSHVNHDMPCPSRYMPCPTRHNTTTYKP